MSRVIRRTFLIWYAPIALATLGWQVIATLLADWWRERHDRRE